MYKYSQRSKNNLATASEPLQILFNEVIKKVDVTVIYGHRNKQEQELMVSQGYSKLNFPNSKHNSWPSQAVDVAPYPIDWNDLQRFANTAKIIFETWNELKAEGKVKGFIRWGGNWKTVYDESWKQVKWLDMPHWELSEKERL
jgi:peptidoglycan L-alanyl-D-glutamate endopeptidase CwlK